MKNKLLIALLLLFVGFWGNAQTPNLIYSQRFSAVGSGFSGVPTVNVNIPSGENRMMVVYVLMERVHVPVNSNYPCSPDGSLNNICDLNIYVGSNLMNIAASNNHYYSMPAKEFSLSRVVHFIGDADGLPTGNTSITIPNLNLPESNADEMAVIVSVFENVKAFSSQLAHEIIDDPTGSTVVTASGSHITVPVGRSISDVVYLGIGGITQQSTLSFSSGWTSPNTPNTIPPRAMSVVVSNNSGPVTSTYSSDRGEPDGAAARMAYRTYTDTSSPPSFTLSRSATNIIHHGHGYLFAFIPFAKPGISGTVYRDNNGLPVNAGGTGGAVYNSSANGILYVNVLDATGSTVIATAQVNNSGVYNIPEGGDLMEGTTYVLQLSRNQGVVGQPAPAKQLHTSWLTVGESLFTSGTSDGSPNGLLTITLGDTNSTTTRFGVNICTPPAITSQPSGANYCQNTTATAVSVTATGATSYQWYRNTVNSTSGGTAVGTNSASYTPVTTATGTFYYYVVVGNGTCSVTSNTATVNVVSGISISSQPTGANYCQNATATALSVTATGATSYQWYRNTLNSTSGGTPVGTNSANYTPVTTATGTFYYYVVVGNGTCSVTSNTAVVNVVSGISISSQPSGANYCQNATATALSVSAIGATSYQWYRNTVNSTSGGMAVGTNSSAYTPVTTAAGTLYYYVVVGNGTCSVTSNIAAVSVTATPATPVPGSSIITNVCPDTTANLTAIQPAAVSGQTYEWHTAATNPNGGTLVANPGAVSNGTYYLYSKTIYGNCYSNTSNAVTVTINACGTCTEPGDFSQNGTPTKVGITVQPKQDGWPTNIPNGFIALQSKSKGMVITRVARVGGGTNGAPDLTTDSVKDPKEGMLVYDLNSECVKLFNGTVWNCISNICDPTN
ncbi:hypothetical protein [Chryseobacterium sp. Leaf394]|uniref:hypothetical protein n=1 Tax=Chryseobacterium sp. Leaf394 TaxID=1736361 RepID=UPI0006FBC79E|nr:hypothetical protein [Chryseobacterium sp. Leaf394]KQS89852.1 hypothetical protein ASG21_12785 [Chryseobacterium sp. Leaf394]